MTTVEDVDTIVQTYLTGSVNISMTMAMKLNELTFQLSLGSYEEISDSSPFPRIINDAHPQSFHIKVCGSITSHFITLLLKALLTWIKI